MLEVENTANKEDIERPQFTTSEKFGSSSTTTNNPFESSSPTVTPNGDIKENQNTNMMKASLREPTATRNRQRAPRIYLNKFRLSIYVQLCVVICILCGLCVLVVAVTTYTNDRNTILELKGDNLVTLAVMKSVQLNQTINFLYNQVFGVTTRVLIQSALVAYYANNSTDNANITAAYLDLQTAIGTQTNLLAGRVYTNTFDRLENLTVSSVNYELPDSLYPTSIPPNPPHDNRNTSAGQVLGPVAVSATPGAYALSFTIPIVNNNSTASMQILGYMSMIVSATGLMRAVNDSTGMGETGQLLVLSRIGDDQYDVILPPLRTPDAFNQPYNISQYPAVQDAFANQTGYIIDTHNAYGTPVSVGYTLPAIRFVQWGILAEQLKSEVMEPIRTQQKLAAITAVVPYTAVCLIISLLVIIFVKSIRDLSRANKVTLRAAENDEDSSSRVLPDPVKERTWWFRDEIADVQRSHNIMRDQLLKQYESLEEQVRIKTAELHGKMEELEVALAKVEEEKLNTQNALQVKEEALGTQERLMHSVAHDLKTPLNGILAPIESWLDSPVFNGEEKAELRDAYLSVRRLKRLTEDLTKYAEDVRFGRLNAQIFNLSVLHKQTQFDFQSQLADKNLDFSTEYIPESCADWQVYGDYYRISQVCNNFIQNAIKFTLPGGRVAMRIRARGKLEKARINDKESSHSSGSMAQLPATFTDDAGSAKMKEGLDWQVEYFEFEVEDNGIGIADEDLSKIFEPWHQLADDKAHSEGYGGIGLGLAICQFWVTKMDGKIEVSSQRAASVNERGWTVFKILLPLRVNRLSRRNSTNSSKLSVRSSSSESQSTMGKAPGLASSAPLHEINPQSLADAMTSIVPQPTLKLSQKQMCRILIAEDEPINQRVVQRMLMKDGFRRITFAQNGFQAIEAVSRAQEAGKQFNLILMDFQMPHVDGPLATNVIRRMPHITQDRLTIIALTAYDDDKSKRDCLSAGMNDFITKPISHAVLRDVLVKHLSLPSVPEDADEDEDEDETLSPNSLLSPASPTSPSNEIPPPTGGSVERIE